MPVSADSLRLAIAPETEQGVPPVGATFEAVRTTGEGLAYEIETTLSDELSGGLSRGVADDILTNASVAGDISFELSKNAAFEMLLEGVLGSNWGDDPLTLTPTPTANQVHDSTERLSYTIEKRFKLDDAPTYSYHLFTGCVVDGMTLDLAPGSPITGSATFMGNEMTTPDTEQGTTYNSAGTNPIMTPDLVTSITFLERADDSPVAWMDDGCVSACTVTIANNSRGIQCIGTLGNTDIVLGRIEIAISMTMYYAGDEPLDHLIDRKEFKLRIIMADSDGNDYTMIFDRVKISSATALATGTNTDVMVELEVAALNGDPDPFTLFITRAPGAAVVNQAAPMQRTENELGAKSKKKEAA